MQWNAGRHRGTNLLGWEEICRGRLGLGWSRGERVDANAQRRPLNGERLGEVPDTGLGSRGMRRAGITGPGVGGDDVEDRACVLGRIRKTEREGARAVEGAVEDDVDDGLPAVRRHVNRVGDKVAGRIVDERVGRTEGRRCTHKEGVDLLGVAHVALEGGALAACCLDELDGLLEWLWPAAADRDLRTTRAKVDCHRASHAATATGDRDDASLNPSTHVASSVSMAMSPVTGTRYCATTSSAKAAAGPIASSTASRKRSGAPSRERMRIAPHSD